MTDVTFLRQTTCSHRSLVSIMSRQRRARRSPPIAPSLCSFRTIVGATIGFFSLIAFFHFQKRTFSTTGNDPPNATSSKSRQYDAHHPRLFSDPSEIPSSLLTSFDAVVILGGGVPESISNPPRYVKRRCDDAIQVSQRFRREATTATPEQQQQQRRQRAANNRTDRQPSLEFRSLASPSSRATSATSLPLLCLSAGTAHMPQLLSADGLPVWESTACAAYLAEHDPTIDPRNIYVETTSYDTIGNAFYARTTHTDWNGWRTLLIITNEFHMDRTRTIFDWIFSLPSRSSLSSPPQTKRTGRKGQRNNDDDNLYNLFYLQSPNVGLTEEAAVARKEREASSTRTVRESLMPKYGTSLQDVYQFLTHEHSLYTAQKLVERGRGGTGGGDDSKASALVRQSYGAAISTWDPMDSDTGSNG